MNDKLIIALAGEIGSGKGTFADYLREKYQAKVMKFSDPLRNILDRLHLDAKREFLQDLSTVLRKRFGEDLLSKTLFEDAKRCKEKIVVIDGVRRESDIEHFKNLKNFVLIFINLKERDRYERLVKRGEKTDDFSKTYEEFLKDHSREAEVYVKNIKKLANYTISNDSTLQEFYAKIDELMSKILKK